MTTKPQAQIAIRSRKGKLHVTVKHGWLDLQGWPAVIVIAIIIAARLGRAFMRVVWVVLSWLLINLAKAIGGWVAVIKEWRSAQ